MERRTKLEIIGISLLILLILIFFWLRARELKKSSPSSAPVAPTTKEKTAPALPPLADYQIPAVIQAPPPGPQEQKPEVIAQIFTERYGSYSNQGNFANLRDLFPQMTKTMQNRTNEFIRDNPLPAGNYLGVTTQALRTEVAQKTNDQALIKVFTQQIEATAALPQARISYPQAEIKLIKNGLNWLVDEFKWL